MLIQNGLTLKTPILGCKKVKDRPRALLRDSGNNPGLVREMWQSNFESAAGDLGIDYDRRMVTFPEGYSANMYSTRLRKFSNFRKEMFECIPEGAEITFSVMLNDNRLTPRDYARILEIVGKHYGISQWGNKFADPDLGEKYGRFDVKYVKRKELTTKLDFDIEI